MPSDLACVQRLAWKSAFGDVAVAAVGARPSGVNLLITDAWKVQMNDAPMLMAFVPLTYLKTNCLG